MGNIAFSLHPMATVHITSQINLNLDQLIAGVAQLETPELEQFLGQVSHLLAQRKSANLPPQESNLLQQINQKLPPDIQQRCNQLREQKRTESLNTDEYQELLQLVDRVETADAERLEKLLQLAHLRNIPLPELMKQLEIETPSPNV